MGKLAYMFIQIYLFVFCHSIESAYNFINKHIIVDAMSDGLTSRLRIPVPYAIYILRNYCSPHVRLEWMSVAE
jgi:hypothetical protein